MLQLLNAYVQLCYNYGMHFSIFATIIEYVCWIALKCLNAFSTSAGIIERVCWIVLQLLNSFDNFCYNY